jgi:hypothetical protein
MLLAKDIRGTSQHRWRTTFNHNKRCSAGTRNPNNARPNNRTSNIHDPRNNGSGTRTPESGSRSGTDSHALSMRPVRHVLPAPVAGELFVCRTSTRCRHENVMQPWLMPGEK